MSRIRLVAVVRLVFTLILGIGVARAEPTQTDVSLVVGDIDTATALEAVHVLRADAQLRSFSFHVYSPSVISRADPAALTRSRVVFVQTVGRGLALTIKPFAHQIAATGGRVYAVGPSWDRELEASGFVRDEELSRYMVAGGPDNVVQMVRSALARGFGLAITAAPVRPMPEIGALDMRSGRIFEDFAAFRAQARGVRDDRPWIGLAFYRSNALSGQLATVRALATALEARGYNVVPFFGFPNEATLQRFALDRDGRPTLAAIGALSLKISNNPATLGPLLNRLDVPIVNLITLNSQSEAQWQASPQGLDTLERSWQVGNAEYGGLIAPTVVAGKETVRDADTGIEVVRETPIAGRIERAADRLAALARLREIPARDKRIALIYYNYPPGKEAIGASYLNVLPGSLTSIAKTLSAAGFTVTGFPEPGDLTTLIRDKGGNLGGWNGGSLDALVKTGLDAGTVQLLPVATYRHWLQTDVPASLRAAMVAKWGEPESSKVMVWRDAAGQPYFVFPTFRFGNLLLAPQPSRGWEQSVESLYHDTSLPPHHQYLAFYLWLQHDFRADAMVHLGTHATHEWLSGKEVGLSNADPGEIAVGAVPQFYPYIVDDVGEAIQAKRRGMATIVSHMIPPLDRAALNPQLSELVQLLSDYGVAAEKSPLIAKGLLEQIDEKARAQGLLKDVGLTAMTEPGAVDKLGDHLRDIAERATPFGLHTFGIAPNDDALRKSAETIAGAHAGADATQQLIALMRRSASEELDNLIRGLSGRLVPAGPGNDPIRTPDSLPTGRNLYGFDPSRLPTEAAWAVGEKLATDLVRSFQERKGAWPERYVFNLWGVESSRHEGVMEAQIVALLGIRPTWDGRGKLTGLEAVPRAALGRPRVDVTIIPSGLYRDMFPLAMKRLDEAVTLAKSQDEADNAVRRHARETRDALMAQGIGEQRAEQLAGIRMFSVPSGAYGTNLDKAIPLSNTYGKGAEADDKLSALYFMRMHHAFGQGLWGDSVADRPELGVDLLKGALKGAQGVVHSRSSNVYAALDGDDFYQYLGGTALAVRSVTGATPEVLVTDMADPKAAKTETLDKYLGREMRTRYLNPKWIEAMMKEGYAGAAFMHRMVENLYGWQVTVPDAVGNEKWQEMFETWVRDRDHLGIAQKFREANNLAAYQSLVDRMLVAVNKGYWQASSETVRELERVNRDLIAEAGVSCYHDTCSSPEITALAEQQDSKQAASTQHAPAPSLEQIARNVAQAHSPERSATVDPPDTHSAAPEESTVAGFLIEERRTSAERSTPSDVPAAGWILLIAAVSGFCRRLLPRRSAARRPV